ncbi:hypothetical protein [Magnetospirillum sp. UT-4]|uniref:DUF6998 domain-containing protein n=1 Tax=Magnetospirillum sp. UT-4 TaxID=2681467 RepID=UPI001383F6E7|nr:hypothetical protein [Magnetospirillum sp. UT-4]CAA7615734.1 conserved hypothetical protein [Magnetospirillum sp. UT-4]
MTCHPDMECIAGLLEQARRIAIDYYRLTGKPLGITGEVGEYEAARLLGLDLAVAREAGYDATDRAGRRLQIKARSIPRTKKLTGQRLGSIDLAKPWDAVLLVLMDELFEPVMIFEADRAAIEAALLRPGSKARNERGALAITKFRSIGRQVWPAP